MKQILVSLFTAAGLFVAASAFAESSIEDSRLQTFLPVPAQPSASQQPCWLDHAQVQPTPLPSAAIAGNLAAGGPKVWNPPGGRPGSEHWNVADLQRACRSQWTRRVSVPDALADFLNNP